MDDIFHKIEALGVRLEYSNDLPQHRLGCYYDDRRLIVVRCNLTHTLEEETLCHEYVHAKYRDRSSHPTIEHRAMREAARMLIEPADYARAERINSNPLAIAKELDVTLHMVEVFHRALRAGYIDVHKVA